MAAPIALLGGTPTRRCPPPRWPQPLPAARAEVLRVFDSGRWWQSGGGVSEQLEERLEAWFRARRVVAVANGTTALELSLRALHIGPGDEVLVPVTTFVSTASAVALVGARPVPIDAEAATGNIALAAVAEAVTPRTRAMIVVHLAGHPVDPRWSRALCDRFGLALIEDSAQAFGASWEGTMVGSAGDLTVLSFQASKLIAAGEGGAVIIRSDPTLASRVALLANCGRGRGSGSYDHVELGTNARITEFSSALALAHMDRYEDRHGTRTRLCAEITDGLSPDSVWAVSPSVSRHDRYLLLLRVPDGMVQHGITLGTVVHALRAEGIPVGVLFPPWPDLPAFADRFSFDPMVSECGRTLADRTVTVHHGALLDERFAGELVAAWNRITAFPEEVSRWQRHFSPDRREHSRSIT